MVVPTLEVVAHAIQVSAIAWSGPKVPEDHPSTKDARIPNPSLIRLRISSPPVPFFPRIQSFDPKSGFFIDTFGSKSTPASYASGVVKLTDADAVFSAIEWLQTHAARKSSAFGDGNCFTIADVAVGSFFGRMEVALKNGFGLYLGDIADRRTIRDLQEVSGRFEGQRYVQGYV